MILKLVSEHDSILKQPTQKWDFDNPPMDIHELVENLCDTMVAERGLGLSANQVGIPYSVFVIGHPDTPDDIICVVNPKIVDKSDNIVLGEEGCLSFPELYGKVKRSKEIRARFANPNGDVQTHTMTGMTARAFQHEFDHMNGVTFVEHMSRYHLDQAKRKQKKITKILKKHKAL
jgi:peptide deformylase